MLFRHLSEIINHDRAELGVDPENLFDQFPEVLETMPSLRLRPGWLFHGGLCCVRK
jgi:hypothetical protein